ncbi:HesA/MoeB/ThiF family protein [Vibrio sp. RC27]
MEHNTRDSDFIQYHRQISVPEFGETGQVCLDKSSVLVIGCGGLGTLVSSYLVSSGLGSIVISDDDVIELSNLPRQLNYTHQDIGKPKVDTLRNSLVSKSATTRVRAINKRMDALQLSLEVELANVVIDCSDNFESRFLLNQVCHKTRTPLISGSASGWMGQLATYYNRPNSSCYQCLIDPSSVDSLNTNCTTVGIISPVTGVVASLQAVEALKLLAIAEAELQVNSTHLTIYDGLQRKFSEFEIQRDPCCEICGSTSGESK